MVYSSCINRTDDFRVKAASKGFGVVVNAYRGKYDYFGRPQSTWLLQRTSSQKKHEEVAASLVLRALV